MRASTRGVEWRLLKAATFGSIGSGGTASRPTRYFFCLRIGTYNRASSAAPSFGGLSSYGRLVVEKIGHRSI